MQNLPIFKLMIKVSILGAGNVGYHLHAVLKNIEDVQIVQWYNRTNAPLEEYAGKTSTTNQLSELKEADIYLISVSDDTIESLSLQLGERNGVVAHTAGSVALSVLKTHKNHGVFYPLQTFSTQKAVDFANIPLCLEANKPEGLALLEQLAVKMGGPTHLIDSEQRKALHIAAVFVNNFTNHLYAIGESICQEHLVPFAVLQPLIAETADKIKSLSPLDAQTGPALRNDRNTLDNHLSLLTQEAQKKLYTSLTKSIQQLHEK